MTLATLCQSCGLCCDGSLFGLVPLEPGEVESARKHRLPVVASGKGFEQPCTGLVAIEAPAHGVAEDTDAHRACSLYAERPRSCRQFECRLYERHRREGGPIAPRLAAVRRVRELFAELAASGLTPADCDDESAMAARGEEGERARQAYRELMQRLEDDFARA